MIPHASLLVLSEGTLSIGAIKALEASAERLGHGQGIAFLDTSCLDDPRILLAVHECDPWDVVAVDEQSMAKLKADKYILMDKDGFIALTGSGREIAEKIYERHTVLTKLLISIGVDEETAAADACKIEHDISDKTFEAMKKHSLNYDK